MAGNSDEALELGARLSSILATGRRESTYKLVTLLALIHYSIDWCPTGDEGLDVNLFELANRVATLYQPSREPFQDRPPLLQMKRDFKTSLLKDVDRVAPYPGEDEAASRRLAQHIAQQPLTHLQNDPLIEAPDFLFDSTWLHKKITQDELSSHGWRIRLLPGVAQQLARLAPLLIPLIERLWVTEVLRFNPSVAEARVEEYLLGADRRSVTRLGSDLAAAQRDRCFYCRGSLSATQIQVDHVLPWSRCGFDGLANLVATDAECNRSKSDSLPDPNFVIDALRRDYLHDIQLELNWKHGVATERMRRTATGQYRFLPTYYRLWRSRSETLVVTVENRKEILSQFPSSEM